MRYFSAILCFALLLMGARAMAQAPANDDFANADVIPGSSTGVTGNNVNATAEAGEPNHSPSEAAGLKSVWWSYMSPITGPITLSTEGSTAPDGFLDTQLAVYTGSSVGSLTLVARNEDGAGLANGWSKLTFNAVAGTVYKIAVDGYFAEAGPIQLSIATGTAITGFTLQVDPTGSGTVARNPAQPAAGYTSNQVVMLTANPTAPATFLGWGGDAAAFGATNPISLTMDGNKIVTASFTTNVGTGPFTLTINRAPSTSSGTVTKSPNKANYDAGEVVTVVAKPSGSRTFIGWTGTDEASADRTNHVTMNADTAITATFSGVPGPTPSPYLEVVGTYTGLFYETNAITQDCSGFFTIKVSKSGKFTGKFITSGKTFTTKGQIDANGDATATIGRAPDTANLQFHVDLTGGSDKITGTVTADCVAQLSGDRQTFTSKLPTSLAGKYTLVFPRGKTDGTNFVPNPVNGHGFAFLTISKTGKVTLRGELADGTKISRSTALSSDGQVPVYVSLYKGEGSLIGWLNVTATEASGLLSWIKPGTVQVDLDVDGSVFNSANKPFLTLANGVVELGGDGLTTPIVVPVTLTKNKFAVTGANENRVTLTLSSSGSLRGNFVNPATQKRTPLKGIVLTNANRGAGYFLSPSGSGYLEVREGP